MWWNSLNANDLSVQFEIGDGDGVSDQGEFIIRRDYDTDHIDLKMEAWDGDSIESNISDTVELAVSTWYCLAFDINLTNFAVTAKMSTDVSTCEYTASGTWNTFTWGGWSNTPTNIAAIDADVFIGSSAGNEMDASVDGIRMRAK
jgi:hypothetical protein